MTKLSSLISGIVFGLGLTISGMVNPEKVLGFLNIFNAWDPSLMFVMIGAILIFSQHEKAWIVSAILIGFGSGLFFWKEEEKDSTDS